MRSEERVATVTTGHLTDDQLMETYVLAGEHRHLSVCRQCKTRFEDLVQAFEQVREDATREADGVFTAERLHDQRDSIMRRIERHGHPAEVVMFPHRPSTYPAVQRVFGPARRWVAAAAAAGVAAGMFLGFAVDRGTHYGTLNRAVERTVPGPATPAWRSAQALDEQFFSEIDAALISSRARELRGELGAIDLMTTPIEIREVSYAR